PISINSAGCLYDAGALEVLPSWQYPWRSPSARSSIQAPALSKASAARERIRRMAILHAPSLPSPCRELADKVDARQRQTAPEHQPRNRTDRTRRPLL